MKKRKTSIKRSRIFQIVLKGGENRNFAWENFDHSMLRVTKSSMTIVYIKPEVKKNDTAAPNKACIG